MALVSEGIGLMTYGKQKSSKHLAYKPRFSVLAGDEAQQAVWSPAGFCSSWAHAALRSPVNCQVTDLGL